MYNLHLYNFSSSLVNPLRRRDRLSWNIKLVSIFKKIRYFWRKLIICAFFSIVCMHITSRTLRLPNPSRVVWISGLWRSTISKAKTTTIMEPGYVARLCQTLSLPSSTPLSWQTLPALLHKSWKIIWLKMILRELIWRDSPPLEEQLQDAMEEAQRWWGDPYLKHINIADTSFLAPLCGDSYRQTVQG